MIAKTHEEQVMILTEKVARLECNVYEMQRTMNSIINNLSHEFLKNALADRKTEPTTEDCSTVPTSSKMEQVDEPQTDGFTKWAKSVADEYRDEPQTEPLQTCSVNGRPYSECSSCEHFKCTADEPQTEMTTEQIVNELLSIKKILDDGKMPKQRCGNCKHLTYRWNKTWCDIKCENPHDVVCDKWAERSE